MAESQKDFDDPRGSLTWDYSNIERTMDRCVELETQLMRNYSGLA